MTEVIIEIDYYDYCYLDFNNLLNRKSQNSKNLDLTFEIENYKSQIENCKCEEKCHLRLYYYLRLRDKTFIDKVKFNNKTLKLN